jgi:hypothetical protein
MKKFFIILLVLLSSLAARSQSTSQNTYTTALGVKFWPTALSLKQFVAQGRAIEADGFLLSNGYRITGLYENYGKLIGKVQLYYGIGTHYGHSYENSDREFGLDFAAGIDFRLRSPLEISLGFQPAVEFANHPFNTGWGGLGIRYIIK